MSSAGDGLWAALPVFLMLKMHCPAGNCNSKPIIGRLCLIQSLSFSNFNKQEQIVAGNCVLCILIRCNISCAGRVMTKENSPGYPLLSELMFPLSASLETLQELRYLGFIVPTAFVFSLEYSTTTVTAICWRKGLK